MKGIMRGPLIIAAVLIVARVVTEQLGMPDSINNLISVATFYVLIAPIYFAFKIAKSGVRRPYLTLLKTVALFAILARAMVIPTYWLAYIYQWPQTRFSWSQAGGTVGPEVTPLMAWVLVPLGAMLVWIITSVVIGGAIGSLIIAFHRRGASADKKIAMTH